MIYAKTPVGQQVVKDRSVALTPRQRSVLILVDGKRSVDELLAAAAGVGVTPEDIAHLAAVGLIEATAAPPRAPAATPPPRSGRSDQQRYADAYPIAVQLTGSLGLRGFRLNLAVEAAGNYQELQALAPKIKEAVGPERYAPLAAALEG